MAGPTIALVCDSCGKSFDRRAAEVFRKGRLNGSKYCSPTCWYAARSEPHHRFWRRVSKGDGCWEWVGLVSKSGYGKFTLHGRTIGAHRAAWILTHGPIPPGMYVCHHCDNPPCCRPDHLFLGTPLDNLRDCSQKGRKRGLLGELSPNAKLTADQVREIRSRREQGETEQSIADGLRVNRCTVHSIVARISWKHLD